MGIPLKEAMKIYPFSRAKLIAGKRGLDKIVESANIQEVPDVDRWMHRGEILFSAGHAFLGMDSVIALMEHINDLGGAALAIKPGQYLHVIPHEMIDCADRIGLPLFELPEDLPYMDCILPIFERITEKQLLLLRRTENIYNRLMQVILEGMGVDGICFTLHQITGQPVFIFSPSGTGTLASCLGGTAEEYGTYAAALKANFSNFFRRPATALKPNQCNVLRLDKNQQVLCIPIFVQDECIAYLVLDCVDCQIPDMDLIAFEHASALIAIELLKERELIEKEQTVREKLLEDLLMKRYSDRQMVFRRGISLGVDLEQPFCIFTIDPHHFEQYITGELRNCTEADIQKIKARIHEIIRLGMLDYDKPLLLLNHSVSVTGLVTVQRRRDLLSLKSVLARIVRRLSEFYPKLRFFAGVGCVKQEIGEAGTSLQEAKLALGCSTLSRYQNSDGIVFFEDLGALSFLSELAESRAMRRYFDEHMGRILAYDQEHHTDLVNTLECYFQCNRNLRVTAENLFIHKNSAIYRIRKIEALIGSPLTDGQVAFDLQLCLLLKNLL